MTVHERMESLADLLVAGGLDAEERAEADRHATDCASCGALIRDARDFAAWAKGLIRPDAAPADLEDRVIGRFRAAGQAKKRRFVVGRRVLKLAGSIAAATGLILLGNAATGGPAEGYRGEVRARLAGLPGLRNGDAAAALPGLNAAESDFRASDRGLSHLGLKGKESSAAELAAENLKEKGLQDIPKSDTSLARDLAGQEGEKDAKIRQSYEEAIKLNSLSIVGKSPAEVDKVVDEGRRQTGYNFSTYHLSTPMARSGEERQGNAGDDGRRAQAPASGDRSAALTGAVFGLADANTPPVPVPAAPAVVSPEPPTPLKPLPERPPQENRKIIRNADASIEVDSYDATYTKLAELAAAEKGFIASANTQKLANGKIQATVVVRVPPERFEAVLARFKDFGTVRHQNIGSEDVTKAYIDLQSRLASKQTLAARLSKLLAEGKGTVKELMEVEVQLGATNEAIEQIVGEIKYYDNRVGLSTITLQIAEKDLGQPFEYVQTLQANLSLTVRDPDDAYAKAQKEITDAGGQVVDSRMNRQSDGSSAGTIRARVDADRFQALRDELKKLGVATNDTVNQQKTAQGGREGTPKVDAPLRKEQAVLDLSVSSPPLFVTRRLQLVVEAADVEGAYLASRKSVEGVGGKVVDGSLMGKADRMVAVLKIQADADKFGALTESLKTAGKVKSATVSSVLPATAADGGAALLRERAEIEFTLASPPQLIAEENGLGKSIRDTLANSWAGLLWSIEKLFVGLSLVGPWVAIGGAALYFWRLSRRRKKVAGHP